MGAWGHGGGGALGSRLGALSGCPYQGNMGEGPTGDTVWGPWGPGVGALGGDSPPGGAQAGGRTPRGALGIKAGTGGCVCPLQWTLRQGVSEVSPLTTAEQPPIQRRGLPLRADLLPPPPTGPPPRHPPHQHLPPRRGLQRPRLPAPHLHPALGAHHPCCPRWASRQGGTRRKGVPALTPPLSRCLQCCRTCCCCWTAQTPSGCCGRIWPVSSRTSPRFSGAGRRNTPDATLSGGPTPLAPEPPAPGGSWGGPRGTPASPLPLCASRGWPWHRPRHGAGAWAWGSWHPTVVTPPTLNRVK